MLLRSIIRKCFIFFTIVTSMITRYWFLHSCFVNQKNIAVKCHKVEKVENLYVYIKIPNSNKNDILVTIHKIWYFNVAIKKNWILRDIWKKNHYALHIQLKHMLALFFLLWASKFQDKGFKVILIYTGKCA